MKTKKTPKKEMPVGSLAVEKPAQKKKSSGAYGDEAPICANTGCALRKKAKCFGFEGCPGFQSR